MTPVAIAPELIRAINNLFTRAYYSAAGYVFESQPFAVRADAGIYRHLAEVREQERQHARMLAQVLESMDRVPEAGAFPYWARDLNYLSLPYMAQFVVESLEDDLAFFDETLALVPDHFGLVRTMIEAIRTEKAQLLEDLRPVAVEALAAEAKRYDDERTAFHKALKAKRAAEKAAKQAAKGPALPAHIASMPDPDEPGISSNEKGKRWVLRRRAILAAGLGGGATAGPSFEDAAKAKGLLDPDEDGISSKEKGKRKVLMMRFKKEWEKSGGGAAAAGPSFEEAAKAKGLKDPDEEGIDNKEKGKRKVLWNRFKKEFEKQQAAGGGGGQTLQQAAAAAGILDPDEEGIDNKEKGKRKVLWNRFKKTWEAEQAAGGGGGGQTFEQAAAAEGLKDPEEPGIDNKEKGKRKVLWNRFKKKWEAAQGGS